MLCEGPRTPLLAQKGEIWVEAQNLQYKYGPPPGTSTCIRAFRGAAEGRKERGRCTGWWDGQENSETEKGFEKKMDVISEL